MIHRIFQLVVTSGVRSLNLRSLRVAICSLLLIGACSLRAAEKHAVEGEFQDLENALENPAPDSRLMVRWWWFGASVTKPEIEREIRAMQQGGIGGFEVQPVYPMSLDDPSQGINNLPYLSSGFLDALHFASEKAHELGMRIDVTLGSGWPFGGPYVPITHAAGMLRIVKTLVPAGANAIPVPSMTVGEKLLAAFLSKGDPQHLQLSSTTPLSIEHIGEGRLFLESGLSGQYTVLFFIESRTGMMVKRPALGAEGFVLDHFDREATISHLQNVGDRLMEAFADRPPYAVFSDSLEVYGSDWTSNFLQQFRQRRGYDLTPYLPTLVSGIGPKSNDVRYDWGRTLTELVDENYFAPIRAWAHEHHTAFRAQAYGPPGATLFSNTLVDLPEGEGTTWHKFSMLRWASSANHLAGKPVTSSEAFTWLHSPAFRATPLDMKAEADVHFLEGSNQLIAHGWPYSPEFAGNPGWSFYAAGAFDDHNPWWIVMPDVTRYLQRVSSVLRQGRSVNDVALLLPTDDAWAESTPGDNSPSDTIDQLLGTEVTQQILDAGLNLDYVDRDTLDEAVQLYPLLILPGIERISVDTYQKIEAYANKGGIVIATRRLPARAPGLNEAKTDTAKIEEISRRLFQSEHAPGKYLTDETQLHELLDRLLKPDVALSSPAAEIGFVHRTTRDVDYYFLANTANHSIERKVNFRIAGKYATLWDPSADEFIPQGKVSSVDLHLEPYESRVVIFSPFPAPASLTAHASSKGSKQPRTLDISDDWRVSFPFDKQPMMMHELHSWTEREETRYFSGTATYERDVELPASYFHGIKIYLDFGQGTPIEPRKRPDDDGMRAWIESPIREVARIYVNGVPAGSVWHPPYRIDITRLVHAGENHIRLSVANLAINSMAGRSTPNYRLLNNRYGERFVPQDMEDLEPLAAGVLGGVHIVAVTP